MTAKSTSVDRRLFVGPTYGIDLGDRAYAVTCGQAEWTMFPVRELAAVSALDRLFERPWLAAILARWFLEHIPSESGRTKVERISASTHYLMLSRPVKKVARIEVVRTDGEIMYVGTIGRAGSAFAFSISDVDRPSTAPTSIKGRVDSRGIRLETAVAFARRVRTHSTQPAASPPVKPPS